MSSKKSEKKIENIDIENIDYHYECSEEKCLKCKNMPNIEELDPELQQMIKNIRKNINMSNK